MPVLIAVLALPMLEIALFIIVGGWIGVGATLALVAAAGVAGAVVLRRTGLAAARRMRRPAGGLAAALLPVAEDAALLTAGVLLIVPGFLTDAVALALLVPPLRRAAIGWLAARVVAARPPAPARHMVIDGDYVDLDEREGAGERDREGDGEGAPPHLTRH